MSQRPSLDDYVDVAERIQDFKTTHPEGSLQTIDWRIVTVEGVDKTGTAAKQTFAVYHAAAYRSPDDTKPGHGIAWEIFPGRTPYTKDSELMNAETSAWGRAIVALGFASNGKIASAQEVRARQDPSPSSAAHPDETDPIRAPNPRIPVDRAKAILERCVKTGLATLDLNAEPGTPPEFHPVLKAQLALLGVEKIGELDSDTAETMELFLAKEEEPDS